MGAVAPGYQGDGDKIPKFRSSQLLLLGCHDLPERWQLPPVSTPTTQGAEVFLKTEQERITRGQGHWTPAKTWPGQRLESLSGVPRCIPWEFLGSDALEASLECWWKEIALKSAPLAPTSTPPPPHSIHQPGCSHSLLHQPHRESLRSQEFPWERTTSHPLCRLLPSLQLLLDLVWGEQLLPGVPQARRH